MTINNLISRWNNSALSYDIPAGFAVFLVSLPLSLGIALASGAYLFSGLIAGIIGGLIVVPLSGSRLAISGATAGLSVIVLTAINKLGFNEFLMAVILAGILQIGLGCLRAGVIAYYFPSAVVNGVLTGMGIILILKQIPHALGYDKDYEGDFAFLQNDDYSSFSELLHMVNFISPGALIIAVLSLTVLLLWERPTIKRSTLFRWLPSPVVATLTGVLLNHLYMIYLPVLALSANHFVTIPETSSIQELIKHLHSPAYQAWQHPGVYTTAVTLALVASLESLLAVEAIDKLDPYRNKTSVNRELLAQGVGNIMSGLLGGLPLTMVVVRSSFNIQAGAKTKLSAFVQGLLLLLTCLLVPHWLNEIPLASLAAILLVVAYRLARPVVFKTMYKAGYYHFVPFCLTIVGLVLTDLLTGIIIGLVIALIAILLENYKAAFYFRELHIGNKIILRLAEHVSFLNKANIQKTLEQLPEKSEVVIDATRAKYIDYDVYEMINEFSNEAKLKNIALTIKNLRGYGSLPPLSNARPPTFDTQQALTPSAVLTILKEGNEHFCQ
ncbi:SulP family inorganic anion transporter [Methylocucumis oryzae]|uniref:SulP family inorganic anion transporter n=1 Tax=Methylocucumis oryzae TaxID=1632867 RepID=UPI000B094DE0|nr:SulP family inorganic anion transporter [Methylocucumis oryzae]